MRERQHFQLTFTCSKSTVELLENGVKYVELTIKTPEQGYDSCFSTALKKNTLIKNIPFKTFLYLI